MLRVVRGDGEADLRADGEAAARVQQRDRRRLERVLGWQGDPAMVAAALKSRAWWAADGEVPLEKVAVERLCIKVGGGRRLGDLARLAQDALDRRVAGRPARRGCLNEWGLVEMNGRTPTSLPLPSLLVAGPAGATRPPTTHTHRSGSVRVWACYVLTVQYAATYSGSGGASSMTTSASSSLSLSPSVCEDSDDRAVLQVWVWASSLQ